jgi:hypothetical protein
VDNVIPFVLFTIASIASILTAYGKKANKIKRFEFLWCFAFAFLLSFSPQKIRLLTGP